MVSTLATVGSWRSFAASARRRRTFGASMSIVYGLVTGEFISSFSVRIASVFGFLVSSGSESN